ncbi:glycerate kinase [Lacticaseibacillus paracasei]|uniref:glycerate kinase family protein n=1 Tax=Lacticaseibacillus paracasei TaxID=1597 RepID=UPI00235866A8|nr:glycerate kinase [Lacticaseibacillus paracasei]WCZ18231.1 glycerate kinase [Lacticaseibacillus paracasei]
MKVVVGIDSFKGSASSAELNQAVASSIKEVAGVTAVGPVSVSDGGEGAVASLQQRLDGQMKTVTTIDLLGRRIQAPYFTFVFENENYAAIESASVVGLDKVVPSPETIRQASSYGLGIALRKLDQQHFDHILIFLGGTGVSDGGLGVLRAFDGAIKDNKGQLLEEGNLLLQAASINLSKLSRLHSDLMIATDVTNPYSGESGAAKVYARQKGATLEQVNQLDTNAHQIASHIHESGGPDLDKSAGAGAAGGLGGALQLIGGQICQGFPTMAKFLRLDDLFEKTDLVITGEGKLDRQSTFGKVPFGMAKLAEKYAVPTVVLCGSKQIATCPKIFAGIFSIQPGPISLTDAMNKENTLANIGNTAYNILSTIQHVFAQRPQEG